MLQSRLIFPKTWRGGKRGAGGTAKRGGLAGRPNPFGLTPDATAIRRPEHAPRIKARDSSRFLASLLTFADQEPNDAEGAGPYCRKRGQSQIQRGPAMVNRSLTGRARPWRFFD